MRFASVLGIVALLVTTAACRTSGNRPAGDKDLAQKLRGLGIEGRTYTNDISQVASIRLGKVYVMDNDLLVEDIHGHLAYINGNTLFARWEYQGMPAPFEQTPCATPTAGSCGRASASTPASMGRSSPRPR